MEMVFLFQSATEELGAAFSPHLNTPSSKPKPPPKRKILHPKPIKKNVIVLEAGANRTAKSYCNPPRAKKDFVIDKCWTIDELNEKVAAAVDVNSNIEALIPVREEGKSYTYLQTYPGARTAGDVVDKYNRSASWVHFRQVSRFTTLSNTITKSMYPT